MSSTYSTPGPAPTTLAMAASNPLFTESERFKTCDYAVANPTFSDKRWSTSINRLEDPHERFKYLCVQPPK